MKHSRKPSQLQVKSRKGDSRSPFAAMRGKEVSVGALINAFVTTSRKRRRFPRRGQSSGLLVMMIGLPASGKSTLTDAFRAAGFVHLNKDAIRQELYGDASAVGDVKEVNRLFYSRLEEACQASANIVVDNLNLNFFYRRGPAACAREHGYADITNIVLDIPLEECLKRNANRDRKVPEEVIRQHAQTLRAGFPTSAEGRLVVLGNSLTSRDRFVVKRVRAPLPRLPENLPSKPNSQ